VATRTLSVEFIGDTKDLERAFRRTSAAASATDKRLQYLGRSGEKTARQLKTAFTGAGVAVAAGLGAVIKQTVDFDRSMRNVNSIAGLSERRFAALRKSVLGLAGKTAQAPQTLSEGLYDLVSSGFNAQQSLKILKSSAKAATAGLTDTATSTKAVAAVLNAYRLEASDAATVSDQLFQTVNLGVINFETLASTIGDVLPFAAQLSVDLGQVGASLATMTKQGLSGEEAATRLKNTLVAFIKPSNGMAAAIKAIGAASGEALIKSKGFQGALEAVLKTTDGTKESAAKLFPNIRALGGALSLTGSNAASARKDLKGFADTSGATDRVFKEQAKSVSFQWNKLKADLSALAIQVGEKLVPKMREAVKAITGFVEGMRSGTDAGGRFAQKMTDIYNAAKPVVQFLKDHPALLKAAAAGWVVYKAVSLAALASIKVQTFRKAFGLGKGAAAAEGAIAGRTYATTFTATSATGVATGAKGTKMKGAMRSIGRVGGPLAGLVFADLFILKITEELANKGEGIWKPVEKQVQDSVNRLRAGIRADHAPITAPRGGVPRGTGSRAPKAKASLVAKASGRGPKAGAASVLEVFHDPAGIPSPGRDHYDHVHVGADGGDLEYLMSVATGQFGLTITSTTRSPAQNVAANGSPTSLHLRGMAFDASGSQSAMIAFAKWVQSYRGGGSGGRALNVKATSRSASRAAAAHKAFNKSQRVGVRSQRAQLRRERRSWMPTRQDIFDTQMASGEALLAQGDPAGADIQAVTLRKRLKQIDRVLARKIKPKRRTRLTQERADILGQLGSLTETYGPQPPEPPEPGPTPGDFGESALALAGLTKTTADDVAALQKLKDIRQAELDLAKASGDPRVITEAANALGQVIASLESLTPTAKDFGSADLALARLTETTADDVAALEKLKGLAQTELDAAKASGDPFRIIEAAGAFGSLIEDLKALQASQPRTVTIDIHDAQFGNLAELNGFAERLAFRIATTA